VWAIIYKKLKGENKMLGWSIVFVVSVLLAIVCFIIANKSWNFDWLVVPGVIVSFFAVILLALMIAQPLSVSQEITVFNQQSAYIETHEPSDPIENAAITNKKIELNTWLFNSQWAKNKFGIFSFYPDSILELMPIQ
jgi:asparagine N-glycosylation enzyme membrane subunit Stt3